MKRSSFDRHLPQRPDRSLEFASVVLDKPRARMAQLHSAPPTQLVPALLKTPGRARQSIRDSARDEPCLVRLPGVCNHDPATTVLSHWPGLAGGRGMGLKSLDLAGAFTCCACHDLIDGRTRRPPGMSRDEVTIAWFLGHLRTLERLAQKGLL